MKAWYKCSVSLRYNCRFHILLIVFTFWTSQCPLFVAINICYKTSHRITQQGSCGTCKTKTIRKMSLFGSLLDFITKSKISIFESDNETETGVKLANQFSICTKKEETNEVNRSFAPKAIYFQPIVSENKCFM